MADPQDVKPVITPQGAIKVERLASFRMPRDLTLGGSMAARRGGPAPAKAKVFTPNLNVQRRKPKEEIKVKEEPVRKDRNARGQAPRGRGDRGRGRTTIQSTGVFSEGMGSDDYKSTRSRFGGGGGGGGGGDGGEATILKPTVDFQATLRADAKEEEAKLKLLLRDDFIDDPEAEGAKVLPIQLPVARGKVVIKKEEPKDEETTNGIAEVKIKQEPVDEDATPVEDTKDGLLDFLCKKEPEFILLQLPDCLPGLRSSSEPDTLKHAQSATAGTSTADKNHQQCTLSTLSESQLGKIEVLRSGAARLRIGEQSFPLVLGTQASFRQDVVAVEVDEATKTGDMLNLGTIKNRMIAPPDWETLLFRSSVGKYDSSVDSMLRQLSRS